MTKKERDEETSFLTRKKLICEKGIENLQDSFRWRRKKWGLQDMRQ